MMKSTLSLLLLSMLICIPLTVSAFPPGGFGPGWNFSKVPGARAWRGAPGNGVFAGDVTLLYDINLDGKIDLRDNQKAYAVQKSTTPGLFLRRGELLKVGFDAVASQPASKLERDPSFKNYKTVVGLEIKGINLMVASGKFATIEEEIAACGRVLVWLDSSRKTLLLDSAVSAMRRVEWHLSEGTVPPFLYVEAVSAGRPGAAYRLTGSVDDSNQHPLMDKFFGLRTAYDHLIINSAN